jgi:hypothetical protein
MDRIRSAIEASIRRYAGIGLLGVAIVATALSAHPRMALDASALLLTLETAVLWQLATAPGVPFGRAAAWVPLDGAVGRRQEARIKALFAETCRAYARRLATATLAVWAADIAAHLTF